MSDPGVTWGQGIMNAQHTHRVRLPSRRLIGAGRGWRHGFTLIEVLVVVAILALLVSVLLPSLVRARESARAAQCQSNLKQMGSGITMYTVDSRSYLPGPLHPMVQRETYDDFYRGRDADAGGYNPDTGFYRRAHLVYYIRRYFAEKGKVGELTDRVSTCPTSSSIIKTNIKKIIESNAWSGYAGYRPFHYIVNSAKVDRASAVNRPGEGPPYYGSKPPFYFGVIYHGYTFTQWSKPVDAAGRTAFDNSFSPPLRPGERIPKKIEVIDRSGREWAVADAWYGEVSRPGAARRVAGTWPYLQGTNSSLSPNDQLAVPGWAFHNTTRQYMMTMTATQADKNPGSPRFTDGKTNAVHFDGHVEGVRVWKGVGNPCFDGDVSCDAQ